MVLQRKHEELVLQLLSDFSLTSRQGLRSGLQERNEPRLREAAEMGVTFSVWYEEQTACKTSDLPWH